MIRLFLTIILFSGFSTPGLANAKPVSLGVVDAESDGKLSAVNIRLADKPTWTKPEALEDHGTFLQIQLPNTIVPEPGKFFDGSGSLIKKIAVFQLTPTTAGVRLFVEKDAAKVRQVAEAELLDKRVVVTIDHAKLDALIAAETGVDLQKPAQTADEVIAATKVERDITAPSDVLKGETPAFKVGGIDLRSKLIQVSMFMGGMLLLMAMAFMAKPMMKKRRAAKAGAEPILDMKMLATLPLAARQKLSLIQVGDEKILIGVTPENVSFITAIGRPAQQAAHPAPAPMPRAFSGFLGGQEAPMPAPKLKDIPGNDAESLRAAPATPVTPVVKKGRIDVPAVAKTTRTPVAAPTPTTIPAKRSTNRLTIAVGDDGAKRIDEPAPGKAIDDVTRLIREKLRNLGANS